MEIFTKCILTTPIPQLRLVMRECVCVSSGTSPTVCVNSMGWKYASGAQLQK